jgi:hypothetical protein
MAKKKIIVIDSEKEKQLTETILKNIKKGKIKENEPSYDIQKEVDEGVYDEEIAEAYREEKAALKKLVDEGAQSGEAEKFDPMKQLDQKIAEMLEKGYADAYTKLTEKVKDGKKDISNFVKSASKLFNNVPSPDINKNNVADFDISCDRGCNCNSNTSAFENEAHKEAPKATGNYEMVNHPTHYNNYEKEVIDMIESIWGTYLAAMWCEITAFKYRMRMGTKPGNSIDQDINKERWYLNKAAELKSKISI